MCGYIYCLWYPVGGVGFECGCGIHLRILRFEVGVEVHSSYAVCFGRFDVDGHDVLIFGGVEVLYCA